jgi:O-antigen ligase
MPDRRALSPALAPAGVAIAAGVAGALLGAGASLAIVGALLCAGVVARPREGAVLIGLAAPLDNIVVVRTASADIRFLEVLWLLVIVSLLVRASLGHPLELRRPPLWLERILIAVALWGFVSAALSGAGFPSFRDAAQIAGYAAMLWVFAASFAVLEADTLKRYLRGAAIIGIVLVALTILDLALESQVPYTVTTDLGPSVTFAPPTLKEQVAARTVSLVRVSVFNQSIVTSAGLMATFLVVALAFALGSPSRADARLGWIAAALSGIVLVWTFSRAAWLFALAAVLLVAWRAGGRRFVFVAGGIGIAAFALSSVPAISARLTDFATESSTVGHFELWNTAIGMANANPLFGTGPGSFGKITGDLAHNFVLSAAAETGWIGAALVLALSVRLLAWGWKNLAEAPVVQFSVWLALAVSVAMNMTMNGFIEEMWWIWAGLMVALAMRRQAEGDPAAIAARGPEAST